MSLATKGKKNKMKLIALEIEGVNEILDHPAKGDRMNEIVILNPDMPGSWVWVIGSNEIVI
eukprot:scaffold196654_cov60-Attheya_sp.AAC.1